MAWEATTLDIFLGGLVNQINSKIDSLQAEADKLLLYKAKVEEKLTELNALLTEIEDFAQRLEASGFYFIKLSPQQGSWSERLVYAENRHQSALNITPQ